MISSRKQFNQFSISILIALSSLSSSGTVALCQARKYERHWAEFRYVIYHNKINRELNIPVRNIGVLIDKESFTEENLKKLYILISKRYPAPQKIFGWVTVSLWQIPTPEEDDDTVPTSENPPDPHDNQYPSAIFKRDSKNAYIRYTIDGPPYWKGKTIVIKGIDPYKRK